MASVDSALTGLGRNSRNIALKRRRWADRRCIVASPASHGARTGIIRSARTKCVAAHSAGEQIEHQAARVGRRAVSESVARRTRGAATTPRTAHDGCERGRLAAQSKDLWVFSATPRAREEWPPPARTKPHMQAHAVPPLDSGWEPCRRHYPVCVCVRRRCAGVQLRPIRSGRTAKASPQPESGPVQV